MSFPVLLETDVEPEWIDYNGHLRDAYYGIPFSSAIDHLMDDIGLDAAYRARTGCTLYTLELHVHFLAEVKRDDRVTVRMRVRGLDRKRLHLMMYLHRSDGTLAATQDTMLLHVDQAAGPGAAPFPEPVWQTLDAMRAAHAPLPEDRHVSRALSLVSKTA